MVKVGRKFGVIEVAYKVLYTQGFESAQTPSLKFVFELAHALSTLKRGLVC
jgi:hypothetical protein